MDSGQQGQFESFINPNDLLADEVEFELKIRCLPLEGTLQEQRNVLRNAQLEEVRKPKQLRGKKSIIEEYDTVKGKIQDIKHVLEIFPEPKHISRLRHCRLRILRANSVTREQQRLRDGLIAEIEGLLDRHGGPADRRRSAPPLGHFPTYAQDSVRNFNQRLNEIRFDNEEGLLDVATGGHASLQDQYNPEPLLPKRREPESLHPGSGTVNVDQWKEEINKYIQDTLTTQFSAMMDQLKMAMGPQRASTPAWSEQDLVLPPPPISPTPPPNQRAPTAPPVSTAYACTQPQAPEQPLPLRLAPQPSAEQLSAPPQLSSHPPFIRPPVPQPSGAQPPGLQYDHPVSAWRPEVAVGRDPQENRDDPRYNRQRYPNSVASHVSSLGDGTIPMQWNRQQLDGRNKWQVPISKWRINFSGDSRGPTVTQFLNRVEILAQNNKISEQELLSQANFLLKEGSEAEEWYYTFCHKFGNWTSFKHQLRLRFELPNKDKVIERQMLDRRQLPQETFNAFIGAMEKLAQQLTKPMTEARKLDIILENMRDSYKPFLTMYNIGHVEELIAICHGLDKAMYRTYSSYPRTRPHQVNNVDEIENLGIQEEETEEELNAINQIINRKKNVEKPREPALSAANNVPITDANGQNNILCWNCRQFGHFWRDCQRPKKIFCHFCGHMNCITANCPNDHRFLPTQQENEYAERS